MPMHTWEEPACVSRSVVSDSLQPHGLYNPPGSSVLGILQARILEWVAIPFSRRSSRTRNRTWVFCIVGRFLTVWTTRDRPNTGSGPGKARWLARGNWKKCPYKWFKLSQGCGKSLSLSPPLWVYPRVRFFLLINTCFTTFHLYVEFHLYTADGSWSCPWPWIPGVLVVRMQCSPCLGLTSISGQESNPALSHCRPRLPEISWVGWWGESAKVLKVFCRGRMHASEFIYTARRRAGVPPLSVPHGVTPWVLWWPFH